MTSIEKLPPKKDKTRISRQCTLCRVVTTIYNIVDDCVDPQKSPPQQSTQHQPHRFNHLTLQQPPPPSISKSKMPPKSQDQADDKRQAAREVIDILQEISDLLVCAHPQTELDMIHDSGFRIPSPCRHSLFFTKRKQYAIAPKTDMMNRIQTWTEQSCRFVCLSLKTGSTPMLWRYAFPPRDCDQISTI